MSRIINKRPMKVLGVMFGALLSSIALRLFAQQANLVPSGLTGVVTLIIREFELLFGFNLPFGLLYLVFNVFIYLFVRGHMGKKFVTLTFVHVGFTSLFTTLIPNIVLTQDVLLLTVFGGILNGLGIATALKMGGSSGGLDFISVYFATVKNKPMWHSVMIFNMVLLVFNGWRYDWTLSFYSIIYQFVSTEILSNLHDRYKLSSLRIVTVEPETVSEAILGVVRHGITKFDGVGMYGKKPRYMLYMVVNSFEIGDVIAAIKAADSKAFIEISNVNRIEGNFRQKPLE